jgi:ABC-2 type transport system permease protein
MKALREFVTLVRMNFLMHRGYIFMMAIVMLAFPFGFVLGMGYLIPNMTKETATYITIGSAAQAVITVAAVGLPQMLSEARHEGRMDYFLSLPISREAYLLAFLAEATILIIPGFIFAIVLGWLRYDISLSIQPTIVLVAILAMLATTGAGMVLAMLIPHMQLVNAITQLLIFYFIFFSPVLLPIEQLPRVLQWVSYLLPPGYAADAMRATLTDLPGTHLGRSLAALAAFSVFSVAISSAAVRRRG